jgi:hypothetical protein
MNNQSQPSFTQHPSADPTEGSGLAAALTQRSIFCCECGHRYYDWLPRIHHFEQFSAPRGKETMCQVYTHYLTSSICTGVAHAAVSHAFALGRIGHEK